MNTGLSMDGQYPMGAMGGAVQQPMLSPQSGEHLKYFLENTDVTDQIANFLRGKVYQMKTDDEGTPRMELVQAFKAKANETGIENILFKVCALTNRSTFILGDIPRENAERIIVTFSRNLAYGMAFYRREWGIAAQDMTMIHETISNMVFAAITRGVHGREKRFWENLMSIGIRESGQQSGGESFLNRINPFGKGKNDGG